MKIINIFLDHQNQHLKQKLDNYHQILNIHDLEIINITNKYYNINNLNLVNASANHKIVGLNKYNYFAIQKLIKTIKECKADIILAYDKKSALLSKYINKKLSVNIPIITICEEYINNDIIGSHSLIISVKKLKKPALEQGQKPHTIYHIPNITNHKKPLIKYKKYYKTPIIGFIGNLNNNKNLTILIESLATLKERSIILKLKIAGIGKQKQLIEDLVIEKNLEKQVKFLGWVKKKESFFSNIDLCYFGSYQEYCTLPLIEAINYAKPIIAMQNAATEEIIQNQHSGIIIPTNNSKILAEALVKLSTDQKSAKEYSNNAFKDINKKFNPQIISEKLINCLNESWLKNKEEHRSSQNIA
jgi:glycosyltransferase involved in cell wall biosynthesis